MFTRPAHAAVMATCRHARTSSSSRRTVARGHELTKLVELVQRGARQTPTRRHLDGVLALALSLKCLRARVLEKRLQPHSRSSRRSCSISLRRASTRCTRATPGGHAGRAAAAAAAAACPTAVALPLASSAGCRRRRRRAPAGEGLHGTGTAERRPPPPQPAQRPADSALVADLLWTTPARQGLSRVIASSSSACSSTSPGRPGCADILIFLAPARSTRGSSARSPSARHAQTLDAGLLRRALRSRAAPDAATARDHFTRICETRSKAYTPLRRAAQSGAAPSRERWAKPLQRRMPDRAVVRPRRAVDAHTTAAARPAEHPRARRWSHSRRPAWMAAVRAKADEFLERCVAQLHAREAVAAGYAFASASARRCQRVGRRRRPPARTRRRAARRASPSLRCSSGSTQSHDLLPALSSATLHATTRRRAPASPDSARRRRRARRKLAALPPRRGRTGRAHGAAGRPPGRSTFCTLQWRR